MNTAIQLDWSEWDQAVTEYSAATDKTLAEAQNRQMLNLAIHGVSQSKRANVAAIRALASMDWWPKFVASVIGRQAGSVAASKAFQSQWAAGEKSKHRKGAFKLDKEERSYAKYARTMSAKILARRSNAITFMRFFFVSLGNAFKPFAGSTRAPTGGRKFDGFRVAVKPATNSDKTASCEVVYGYKQRGEKTASGAEKILEAALARAIPETIADMQKETERRMEEDARRYSAI